MKKIITLLLCLGMLTGCGGNKHKELLQLLDEGEYTKAVDYINNLAYEEAKNNGTIKTQNDHMKYLYGSWEYAGSRTDLETFDIEFKDNGTCMINGKEYLWNITNEYDSSIDFDILEGATKTYSFQLSYDKNVDTYFGYFSVFNKENESYNNMGYYRNPKHYEIIDLTTDNWLDYFEPVEQTTFNKDAFGETSSCTYQLFYKLKDKYMERLNYNYNQPPIAYEYSYEQGQIEVTYNLEEETFELGEFEISKSYPTQSSKGAMTTSQYDSSNTYYGFRVMSNSPSTLIDGRTVIYNYCNNPQMTRIQGNLYLWKGLD